MSFQSSVDSSPASSVDAGARALAVKRNERRDDDDDDGEGRSNRRRGERSERYEGGDSAGATFIDLKIRIRETFSAPSSDSSGDDDSGGSGFEGQFAASIRVKADGNSFEAKIKLKAEGEGSAEDFNQAVQSFTEALFGALRSLYGALTGSPATPSQTPAVTTGAKPPLLTANSAAAAASTTSAPTATSSSTTADASATEITDTSTTPVTDAATSTPTAIAGSTTSAGTSSIVVKLRLSYSTFESSVGPLMKQLAQPDVAQTAPRVAPMLDDLSERFDAMVAAAPAGSKQPATLAEFLKTLAESFPDNSSSPVLARPATPTSNTSAAGAETSATDEKSTATGVATTVPAAVPDDANPAAAVGDAALTTPPSSGLRLVSAQFDLKQVLSYSANGSTLSFSSSLRGQMVYASA